MFSDKDVKAHPVDQHILSWERAQNVCLEEKKYPSSIGSIQRTVGERDYSENTYWTGVTRMYFITPLHGKHVYALILKFSICVYVWH